MTSTPTTCPATATRDAVFATPSATPGYSVEVDNGARFDVLAAAADGTGYAWSPRTGLVVRWVATGRRVTSGCVRARVEFPTDTGDRAGTLTFGTPKVDGPCKVGARVSADLLCTL